MAAKQFWLMKSEPDAFGIADLKRVKREPWTGVRNYQARNFMRQMKVGDAVLFYHSNAKPSGVAGLATVSKAGIVDETQFDPASKYFEPKATRDKPIWDCVEVKFESAFADVLPLDALRSMRGLEDMWILRRGTRLSVTPVTAREYDIVVAAASGSAAKKSSR